MPRNDLVRVTQYHLSGDGSDITFRTGGNSGPSLKYNNDVFEGPELSLEHTTLGLLVSTTLKTICDGPSTVLSLAVPEANRPSEMRSIPINTFAVRSTFRSSIAGPGSVSGQIHSYDVIALKGNAS